MKELMSKTRKILVDTARQLFAQKGIDNVEHAQRNTGPRRIV